MAIYTLDREHTVLVNKGTVPVARLDVPADTEEYVKFFSTVAEIADGSTGVALNQGDLTQIDYLMVLTDTPILIGLDGVDIPVHSILVCSPEAAMLTITNSSGDEATVEYLAAQAA